MKYYESSTRFRVAGDFNLPKGIYYINWEIDEERFTSQTPYQYDPPVKTLVEARTDTKAIITIASIPLLVINSTSIPIAVSTNNAPYTDVAVRISLETSVTGVSISPEKVEFLPNINTRNFEITISSEYVGTAETSYILNFEVIGTNAASYSEISPVSFSINQTNS